MIMLTKDAEDQSYENSINCLVTITLSVLVFLGPWKSTFVCSLDTIICVRSIKRITYFGGDMSSFTEDWGKSENFYVKKYTKLYLVSSLTFLQTSTHSFFILKT